MFAFVGVSKMSRNCDRRSLILGLLVADCWRFVLDRESLDVEVGRAAKVARDWLARNEYCWTLLPRLQDSSVAS